MRVKVTTLPQKRQSKLLWHKDEGYLWNHTPKMVNLWYIYKNLSWTINTSKITKAWQCFYLLSNLRKAHLSPTSCWTFTPAIQKILTNCITVWYGSCTVSDQKALQEVVKCPVHHWCSTTVPSIKEIHHKHCIYCRRWNASDTSHPSTDVLFSHLVDIIEPSLLHQQTQKVSCPQLSAYWTPIEFKS